jgi:hypothetical protein
MRADAATAAAGPLLSARDGAVDEVLTDRQS